MESKGRNISGGAVPVSVLNAWEDVYSSGNIMMMMMMM